MASSSALLADAAITAAQFNNLRTDLINGQEVFVPVTFATDLRANGAWPIGRLDATAEVTLIVFHVPTGFTAITKAVIVATPQATQASADYDYSLEYGGANQAYNTHTGSDTATTYNATSGTVLEIDISGQLGSLAAGDYVAVEVKIGTVGHDLDVHGVLFQWTASTTPAAVVAGADDAASEYVALRDEAIAKRELFVPATHGDLGLSPFSKWVNAPLGFTNHGYVSFIAPTNYSRITDAVAVFICRDAVPTSQDFDYEATYAANGEAATNETDLAKTTSGLGLLMEELDASGALDGMAAGDYVGIDIEPKKNPAAMFLVGFRLKWINSEGSSVVVPDQEKTVSQYNNLRTDILNMRETWHPAVLGATGGAKASWNNYPVVRLTANTHEAFVTFNVPQGYASITDLVLVLRPHTTRTISSWNVEVGTIATGETLANPVSASFTPSVTADQIYELDLSGSTVFGHASATPAAGDRACIRFYLGHDDDDVDVLGVRFKWA